MPRGKHLVRETRAGFRPIGTLKEPVKPPPKPIDAEQTAVPPAYWRDRREKKGD
jgi:hypothetical protein